MMKQEEQDQTVLHKERRYKAGMTEYHDRRHAKLIDTDVGDKILRPQKKTTVKIPFDLAPLTVVKKKGYMVTAQISQGKLVTRAGNKFKKVTAPSSFFRKLPTP